MLKYYVETIETLKRLGRDQDGVVSFEYIIVAACIIAVVAVVFGKNGTLQSALNNGLDAISTALTTAVGS